MSGDVKPATCSQCGQEMRPTDYLERMRSDHDRIVKELQQQLQLERAQHSIEACELTRELEQAEAALLAYQQEAVRLCDESKLYDTADAIRNLPITPRAEAIGRVLEQVRLHYGGGQCGCSICSAWRNLNESERQHKGAV